MMNDDDKVTVVTPTYNRGYILDKCYQSLKNQTSKSFKWLVVDDGSTDNTEDLVLKWKEEGHIQIEYLKKENGGKASALNLALGKTDTEYFVCLDSDDQFTGNAIEDVLKALSPIKNNDEYCGIIALRNTPDGGVMGGERIPEEVIETTVMEITDRYRIHSEFIQFYKTSVISNYRFPEIQGEKFISPEFIAREINRKHKFKVSQKSLCVCDYLEDGLTKNKVSVIIKNPRGYTLTKKQSYELAEGWPAKSKHGIMYIAGSILSGDKDFIKNSQNRALIYLLYPFGWLAYRKRFK